jgi:hypothetical protein
LKGEVVTQNGYVDLAILFHGRDKLGAGGVNDGRVPELLVAKQSDRPPDVALMLVEPLRPVVHLLNRLLALGARGPVRELVVEVREIGAVG